VTDAVMGQLIKQLDRIELQCQDNARLRGKLETRIEGYDARAQAVENRLSEAERYIAQQQGRQQANRALMAAATGLGGLGGASGVVALIRALM